MLSLLKNTLSSQYGAALVMLEDGVSRCDARHWEAIVGGYPFWHVAYHALFYTDLLSPNESAFRPQSFHQENSNFFGRQPFPPFTPVAVERPYDKQALLAYATTCLSKVEESLARESEATLGGESGFPWLPLSRAELHVYNIRHIQHHTGQLSTLLVREQGAGARWVGTRT